MKSLKVVSGPVGNLVSEDDRTQKVSLPWWLSIPFLVIPVVLAVTSLPGELAESDTAPWSLLVPLVLVTVCLWPMVLAKHWIERRDDALVLKYWPILRREVKYTDIVSVTFEEKVTFSSAGGIGLRLGGGVLGFINQFGPALSIHTQGGKKYLIVVPNPDDCARLSQWLNIPSGINEAIS